MLKELLVINLALVLTPRCTMDCSRTEIYCSGLLYCLLSGKCVTGVMTQMKGVTFIHHRPSKNPSQGAESGPLTCKETSALETSPYTSHLGHKVTLLETQQNILTSALAGEDSVPTSQKLGSPAQRLLLKIAVAQATRGVSEKSQVRAEGLPVPACAFPLQPQLLD